MTGSRNAGPSRLMFLATAAALGLLPASVVAQGSTTTTGRPLSRVMIVAKDSAGTIIITPVIDSLIKRLNTLPVGSAEFVATNRALEEAMQQVPLPAGVSGTFRFRVEEARVPANFVPQGTLGFTTDGVNRPWYGPGGNYLQYFEYPTVVAIETNSPAARAGVRAGDLLVAYDGVDVKENIINMTRLLTPGRPVTVRLRRDGDLRDVAMRVEKASASLVADRRAEAVRALGQSAPVVFDARRADIERATVEARARAETVPAGSRPSVARAVVSAGGFREYPVAAAATRSSGVLGAAMTDVDEALGSVIVGMDGRRGVLVTKVPSGSPADRTGLRGGDVILRVDGSDVTTVAQIAVRIALAEQNGQEKVKLTVLRSGKQQEITYLTRDR